ncbi:MAG TPA: bis(5'-nucleosyl)-tetraphosphatase (symmetrical) YqeK [Spirochaetia bacterium]|nr:bis(5'-nucleosyl)-tetraphosphatase (symmetrical) YqeK [Spirochaetia bacterium]
MDDRNIWRSRAAALVEATLSRPRLSHSREVARLSSELCDRFHADEDKGYIAGISHDLARELEPSELLLLAERDGLPLRDWERANPILLHGRAAAAVLTKHTGYDDAETLQAIRDHVTGRGGMGPISKIVFAADFLEPTRDFVSPEFRRRTLGLSLDEMVLAVLERKIHFVKAASREIAPDAQALRQELKSNV